MTDPTRTLDLSLLLQDARLYLERGWQDVPHARQLIASLSEALAALIPTQEQLQQQLDEERRACGYWFKEANEEHNRAEKLEAQLAEARKDVAYHADCRPNRRQAEAAMADAVLTTNKWAEEVAAHRTTTEQLAALRAQLTPLAQELRTVIHEIRSGEEPRTFALETIADKLASL